jgi:hypothetical protein
MVKLSTHKEENIPMIPRKFVLLRRSIGMFIDEKHVEK